MPLAAAAAIVLIVFLAMATRSRPPAVMEYDIVHSDSIPDPSAIGMCALGRASGTVEGEIVGLVERQGSEKQHFRIRSLTSPGAEYVMEAGSIQVVKCPDAALETPMSSRGQAPR